MDSTVFFAAAENFCFLNRPPRPPACAGAGAVSCFDSAALQLVPPLFDMFADLPQFLWRERVQMFELVQKIHHAFLGLDLVELDGIADDDRGDKRDHDDAVQRQQGRQQAARPGDGHDVAVADRRAGNKTVPKAVPERRDAGFGPQDQTRGNKIKDQKTGKQLVHVGDFHDAVKQAQTRQVGSLPVTECRNARGRPAGRPAV